MHLYAPKTNLTWFWPPKPLLLQCKSLSLQAGNLLGPLLLFQTVLTWTSLGFEWFIFWPLISHRGIQMFSFFTGSSWRDGCVSSPFRKSSSLIQEEHQTQPPVDLLQRYPDARRRWEDLEQTAHIQDYVFNACTSQFKSGKDTYLYLLSYILHIVRWKYSRWIVLVVVQQKKQLTASCLTILFFLHVQLTLKSG